MKRDLIEAGGVYYPGAQDRGRDVFRRVIALHDLHLVYSDGGDHNHVVLIKTFQRWARRKLEDDNAIARTDLEDAAH